MRPEDMERLAEALAQLPKRDNRLYHDAIAQARRAFADAQAHFEGPVTMKVKQKVKKNGTFVIRFSFREEGKSGR